MDNVRFSLMSLIVVVLAFCLLLSLILLLGVNRGILVTIILTSVTYLFARKLIIKRILWVEIALFLGLWLITLYDLGMTGPYVRWYNERTLQLATDANLIGANQDEVEKVLGKADLIETSTYDPGVTFIYAPYAHLPAAAVQVHCRDGKVASIELYDD